MSYLILLLAVSFALNMGGSGIAPSFSAEYGSGVLSKKKAAFLFALFVFLGAYLLGFRVVKVISSELINPELLTPYAAAIIFSATTLSLFLSNLLKIPASTSQITVFSILGYGLNFGGVYGRILLIMIPLWFILPAASLILCFLAGKYLYPKIQHWDNRVIKVWDISTSCYTAFSIGSNNVANASGVLSGAGIMGQKAATYLLAPFFGIGGYLLGSGNLDSIGGEVTELDMNSAGIISLVSGTLLISASLIGVPQSLVQLNSFAVFGFGASQNDNHFKESGRRIIKKSFAVWIGSPLLGFIVAFLITATLRRFSASF